MTITINYKSGYKLKQEINYINIINDVIHYTVKRKIQPMFETPASIPLEYVDSFEVLTGGDIYD